MKIIALQVYTELGYDDVIETIISTYPKHISMLGYNSMVLESDKENVFTEIYSENIELAKSNANFISDKLREIEIEHSIDFRELEDSHYLYAYKEFLKPLQVGDITIIPNTRESFENFDFINDSQTIFIAKQYAFGTGVHETTSLAMELLYDYSRQVDYSSKKIIDVGSGTGILSLLCSRLGGVDITAIDIDIDAVNCTLDNAKYNDINLSQILEAEASDFVDNGEHFDIIISNIETDFLVNIIDDLYAISRHRGIIILSGILIEKFDKITAKISEHDNIKIVSQKSKNDWIALMLEIL